MAPPNSIERHVRWLVDSDFAFVRPKAGAGSAVTEQGIGHATPQRLAVEEANQVLTFLERQPQPVPPAPGGSPDRPAAPSPPRTPPEEQAMAKAYPHHIRYMGAACRAPPSKALFYLEQAVDAGSRLAGAEAGQMYILGIGAPCNYDRGFSLLDSAVSIGHPGAMLAVGKSMRDGEGLPRDAAAGVVWIERAAHVKYCPAMHELAEMFEDGSFGGSDEGSGSDAAAMEPGARRDVVQAFRWYKSAAELDFAPSQLNIAKLFLLGASMRVAETPSEAELKAKYWLDRAAANGSLEARGLLQRATKHDDPEDDADGKASRSRSS